MRIYASDPAFAQIDTLANMIAFATNPHLCHGVQLDLLQPERLALIAILKREQAVLIDPPPASGEGPLADYINSLVL